MSKETYTNVKDIVRAKSGRFLPKPERYDGTGTPLHPTDWQAWLGISVIFNVSLVMGCVALAYQDHLCHGGAPLPTLKTIERPSNSSAY